MAPVKLFGSAAFTNVAWVLVCGRCRLLGQYFLISYKMPEHLARNPFGEIPAFQDGDVVEGWEVEAADPLLDGWARPPRHQVPPLHPAGKHRQPGLHWLLLHHRNCRWVPGS